MRGRKEGEVGALQDPIRCNGEVFVQRPRTIKSIYGYKIRKVKKSIYEANKDSEELQIYGERAYCTILFSVADNIFYGPERNQLCYLDQFSA